MTMTFFNNDQMIDSIVYFIVYLSVSIVKIQIIVVKILIIAVMFQITIVIELSWHLLTIVVWFITGYN